MSAKFYATEFNLNYNSNHTMVMVSTASSQFNVWPLLALISLLVLVIFLAVHLYFSRTESFKLGLEIPGPYPLPILGNAHMAIGKTSHGEYR